METVPGRILSVHVDQGVPVALVEVDRAPACARCAAGRGCGAGALAGADRPRRLEMRIAGGLEVNAGDAVDVGIGPGELLGAAATVYGLPLSGAALGAVLAWIGNGGDAAAAAGAIAGGVAGLLLARWRLRTSRCIAALTPTIVRRRDEVA